MNRVAISVLIASIIAVSVGLDCSDVIFKESQGVLSYLAQINYTVPVSTGDLGWTLTLTFDQNFTGVGVWQGYVSYVRGETWAEIVNKEGDERLQAGEERSLRFRVNYGVDIPVPKTVSLRFQDIELCN